MHNSGLVNTKVQGGYIRGQDSQNYNEDYMTLDDNLFELDSESRDLIFGRNGMGDNSNIPNQHYEPSPMLTDNNDLNNILAQMPTPVSNDIRASTTSANAFMSPLQVDQPGYDRMNGVSFQSHGNDEMFFTPLLSPAVTPMDVMRIHENDNMGSSMDPVYFSPLSSPALERFPHSQHDPRRSQSMVALSNAPSNRRTAENMADVQRNSVRRAPYHSPVARATINRKRNSITHLNLNANGSPSEQSSDSVSPEPLPSSSMPPPPPRNTSSSKLSEKGRQSKSGQRQRRPSTATTDNLAPATPSSFLNMTLQHTEHQGPHTHGESTVTFDHGTSTDTSPNTVKSASSTPTFGPISTSQSMGSPSFISIPSSYDPNSMVSPNVTATTGVRRQIRQPSRAQSRSSSSSPAFKPTISPNLKPLLPGGTPNDVANTLASKSNYQNILEGNHSSLGLSYPKELSSGIESRRTSHKVAEQARRSRINNAIDQLGAMLPGETDGISKAITVEKAIDYIKNLEDQLAKAKAELASKT